MGAVSASPRPQSTKGRTPRLVATVLALVALGGAVRVATRAPAPSEERPQNPGPADFELPGLGEEIGEAVLAELRTMETQRWVEAVGAAIDDYLARRGSPLAGYGHVFVAEGLRTGINPLLPVAIAGKESSFGRKCFARFNAWGMLAYPQGFTSWEEGIKANFEWLRHYYGAPQEAYDCRGYCVPDHPWMEHVQAIIKEMERAIGYEWTSSGCASE